MLIWLVLLCQTPKPPIGSEEATQAYFADCAIMGTFDAPKLAEKVALELSQGESAGKVGVQKVRIECESMEERIQQFFR